MEEKSDLTVLIVGMGTSPAVLTETVWTLAHQEPPTLPDEIVVLCTASARDVLVKDVLSGAPSIWDDLVQTLRKEGLAVDGKLVLGKTSIRVIPDARGDELHDLRSCDDNLRAADFILREIRQYTESSDTTVLASIAGGRKTMSALLFSCMTLLGREQDKVYHVLPPEELDGGSEPPLYFPKRGRTYVSLKTRQKIRGERIRSELFEVPFVRMRGWYQDRFKSIPPSYRTLVSRVQSFAPPAVVYPEIEIDAWNGWVKLDGRPVPLSKTCFAALFLLASGCPTKELYSKLLKLHASAGNADCDWLSTFREGMRFSDPNNPEELNKVMSELRKRLREAGFTHPESLVPQRGAAVSFMVDRIAILDKKGLMQLSGIR